MNKLKEERSYVEGSLSAAVVAYGKDILLSDEFRKLKDVSHHGENSNYDHVMGVCLIALNMARRHRYKIHVSSLVRAALLHDYCGYDWHVKPHPPHHATKHAHYAAEKAKAEFGLNEIEEDAIRKHMWPLANWFPKYKESWLVTQADKRATWYEWRGKKYFVKEREEIEEALKESLSPSVQ
jgi:uncharacterized protein